MRSPVSSTSSCAEATVVPRSAASYGLSTHGDARQRQASATLGVGDLVADGYNVFAGLSHLDQEPVKNEARWHSQTADYRGWGLGDLRSTTAIRQSLHRRQPDLPATSSRVHEHRRARLDAAGLVASSRPIRDLVTESKRDALFIAGTAALPRGFELFGDAMFGRTVVSGQNLNVPSTSYPRPEPRPRPLPSPGRSSAESVSVRGGAAHTLC